ncbi:MAG: B12-binding domain-containing radical SAM protein [Desulfobacterales bacterium]|nr:B12-binding domain-containing radical SAM protein [Desulfobacterales bacterium]
MKNSRVLIIAADQPLDYDTHFKNRLKNLMSRAARHASRFNDLNLPEIQAAVNNNISKLQLRMNDKYMGLLDLMNYTKNGRQLPGLTPKNFDKFLTHSDMITLNGIYLYHYLRSKGFEPEIIQNFSLADWPDLLRKKPLAVCISSNFIYLDEIGDMAVKIKGFEPQIPVIAGGMLVKKVLNAGPNLFPETMNWLATFQDKVDIFVIEFQGEQTLVNVLSALRNEADLADVPNLAFFDGNKEMVFTHREQEYLEMDHTTIDWSKIPRAYLRKTLPVTSSRGCIFRCRFCTCWRLCPEVHYKSLPVLRNELRLIHNLGFVKHIRFTDDNLTGNRKRMESILEMMIGENFDFTWSTYARASALTPKMVKLMKRAGCEFVNMGIESGSQTILNNMDKHLKRDRVIEAIKRLNDHGIYGEGGFILGYPGETPGTFTETVDLINSSKLPFYQPNLFYYSKDMLVNEDKDKFGLSGLGLSWRHNTMDSAEASRLMVDMIQIIEHGFNEPQVSVWETFRLLRGEGYRPEEIYELLKLKRSLKLTLEASSPRQGFSAQVDEILKRIEAIVKGGSRGRSSEIPTPTSLHTSP